MSNDQIKAIVKVVLEELEINSGFELKKHGLVTAAEICRFLSIKSTTLKELRRDPNCLIKPSKKIARRYTAESVWQEYYRMEHL